MTPAILLFLFLGMSASSTTAATSTTGQPIPPLPRQHPGHKLTQEKLASVPPKPLHRQHPDRKLTQKELTSVPLNGNHDIRIFPTFAICTGKDNERCTASFSGQVFSFRKAPVKTTFWKSILPRVRNIPRFLFTHLLASTLGIPPNTPEYLYRLDWLFGVPPKPRVIIEGVNLTLPSDPNLVSDPALPVAMTIPLPFKHIYSQSLGLWDTPPISFTLPPTLATSFLLNASINPFHTDLDDPRLGTYSRHAYFSFDILLLRETGISMISDIDDTIKKSATFLHSGALRTLLYLPGDPIKGAAKAYSALAKSVLDLDLGPMGFHYISGSPKAIIHPIRRFLRKNSFPPGSIHLTTLLFDTRRIRMAASFLFRFPQPMWHKYTEITAIIEAAPRRFYLLVGDAYKNDAEIYARIYHDYISNYSYKPPCIAIRIPKGDLDKNGVFQHWSPSYPLLRRFLKGVDRKHLRFYYDPINLPKIVDLANHQCDLEDTSSEYIIDATEKFWNPKPSRFSRLFSKKSTTVQPISEKGTSKG